MASVRPGAYGALLAIGIGWGGSVVATKVAVSTGHSPLGLVFWQQVISALVLGGYLCVRRREIGRAGLFRARNLTFFLGLAIFGTVLPNGLFYSIAPHISAGVLSILIAMVPMFTLAIALPLRLEAPSLRRGTGVVLGAFSIILIVGPEAGLPNPGAAPYVLVGLLIPFLYGCEAIFVAMRMPHDLHPVSAVFGASLLGVVIMAPVMLIDGVWVDPFIPWGAPEWSLVVVSLLQVGCYTGYVSMVGTTGPLFASLVAYLVTISGVIWGVILLGEAHSSWFWAALVVMLGGMTLVQPKGGQAELA